MRLVHEMAGFECRDDSSVSTIQEVRQTRDASVRARPEEEIARQLEAGDDPVRAIHEWIGRTSLWLGRSRRGEPHDLHQAAAPEAPDPLLVIVARQLIAATPEAAALATELEETSRELRCAEPGRDAVAAVRLLRARREAWEALREEHDLLRLQLRRAQGELEARYRKARAVAVRTERAAIAAERQRLARPEGKAAEAPPCEPATRPPQAPPIVPVPAPPAIRPTRAEAPVIAATPLPAATEPARTAAQPPTLPSRARLLARAWRTRVRQARFRRQAALVRRSPLFDAEWYRRRYKAVAKAGIDPALYFVRFGARKRHSPSAAFDGAAYLDAHPEVVAAGMNPLVHHLMSTKQRGARPMLGRETGALRA